MIKVIIMSMVIMMVMRMRMIATTEMKISLGNELR